MWQTSGLPKEKGACVVINEADVPEVVWFNGKRFVTIDVNNEHVVRASKWMALPPWK